MSLGISSVNAQYACIPPPEFISAGIGKPTYPINQHTVASYLKYWRNIDEISSRWREDPDKLHESSAVDYGDPRGDKIPLEIMAKVMSSWYDVEVTYNGSRIEHRFNADESVQIGVA